MKSLFKNRVFMTLTCSDLISNLGDSLFYLAIMNYILVIPETEFAVAVISFSETIPMMTGIFSGDLADQTNNKTKWILITQLLRVMIYIAIGCVLSFSPALWIIIIIAVLNLMSDLLGQYENSLFIPISLRVVSNEEREDAMAFKQILVQGSRIAFMSAGGLMVAFFTYQQIAFINAGSFLLAAFLFLTVVKSITDLLLDYQVKRKEKLIKESTSMWVRLNDMFQTLKNYPLLLKTIIIFTFVNGSFSVINTLIIVSMKTNEHFKIMTNELTIAALPILMILGGIIGASVGRILFKKSSLMQNISLTMLIAIMMYIGFLLQNAFWVFACLLLAAILSGVASPRFSAMIMNTLPEDNMALVIGGLNTFLTLGIVIISGGVSILINIVTLRMLIVFMLIFSILVLIFCLKNVKTNNIEKDI